MPGPNWLTQAELDDIRAQQIDLISEIGGVGDIKRQVFTSDGAGGATRVLNTVASNVPMRHWISSGSNGTSEETKFWGEQERAQTDAFVVLAWNQDIEVEDVIIFASREWRVVGVQATDALITAKRVRCEAMR